MPISHAPAPAKRTVSVRLADGSTLTVTGRRAAIILHLLRHAAYLDAPDYALGQLLISWNDEAKLDVQATRYAREHWSGRPAPPNYLPTKILSDRRRV